MENTNKRNLNLDVIRIIACISVVMVHATGYFVELYKVGTPEFSVANFLDDFAHTGVAVFVMLSGALMLNENKTVTVKRLFGHNIKNILILTFSWSAIYTVIYNVIIPYNKGKALDIHKILDAFVYGHYHMWYLYMAIGLYLITPFLRKLVKKENSNLVLLFIVISLVANFMSPALSILSKYWWPLGYISGFFGSLDLKFFTGYITYYLTGWYLVHIGIPKKSQRIALYIAGAVSIMLTTLYVHRTGDFNTVYSNFNIFIYLYVTGFFCMFTNIKREFKFKKLIFALSNLSFGVYLIHVMVLDIYKKTFRYSGNPLEYILVSFAVVTVVSFAVSFVLSKIPGVKKLLRG